MKPPGENEWQPSEDLTPEEMQARLCCDGWNPANCDCWVGRIAFTDGKSLLDSPVLKLAKFVRDWGRIGKHMGVERLIKRAMGQSVRSGADDADSEPSDDAKRVEKALLDHNQACDAIFDFYAALGATGSADLCNISLNLWTQFLIDFKLIDQKSKFLKQSDLDTLFITIDTIAARAQKDELKEEDAAKKGLTPLARQASKEQGGQTAKFDDKKQKFSRVEFVTAITHIAIKKYVDTKEMKDVAEAVARLLNEDIIPKLRKAHAPRSVFRLKHLYSQQVSSTIRPQLASLRSIFEGLVARGQQRRQKLLNVTEWQAFLRAAKMVGPDLSERDATLAFSWSRMGVADERTETGHLRETCLPFEGFLEALCRISALKAMPSSAELEKAHTNAGVYLEELRTKDADAYQTLLKERARPWGAEPSQPLADCIGALVSVFVRIIGQNTDEISPADMKVWMQREMVSEEERGGTGK